MNTWADVFGFAIAMGLTIFGFFGLPWLRTHWPTVSRKSSPLPRNPQPSLPFQAAPPVLPTHPTPEQPLPLAQVLTLLSDRPDDIPHLFTVGGTGAGKSTFARLILGYRVSKGEQYLILTGKRSAVFEGVPSIGRDPMVQGTITYEAVRDACQAILQEVARRDEIPTNERQFVPLTILIDDATILFSEVPEATEVLRVVGLLGRELRMRLIVQLGSLRVKELGLEGRGDLREHFAVVEYLKNLRDVRTTTLRPRFDDENTTPFDARGVPQLAHQFSLPADQVWHRVEANTSIQGQKEAIDTSTNTGIKGGIPDMEALNTGIDDDTLIQELVRRGQGANQIFAIVGGNRNTVLGRVRELKEAYSR